MLAEHYYREDFVRDYNELGWPSQSLWHSCMSFVDETTRPIASVKDIFNALNCVWHIFGLECKNTITNVSSTGMNACFNSSSHSWLLVFTLPLVWIIVSKPLLFCNHFREEAFGCSNYVTVVRWDIAWTVQVFPDEWFKLKLDILKVRMVFEKIVSCLHCPL